MGTQFPRWMVTMNTDYDPNQTVRIRISRSYKCGKEKIMLTSKNVYKDPKDGKYRCNSCHEEVQDVTNTVTGHDFLEILAL